MAVAEVHLAGSMRRVRDRPKPIRAMTWNIHAGIGPDGCYNLARILALIHRHTPDVVALQEVEARGRTGAAQPFRLLRDALGGHAVEAPTIVQEDGHYGHMLVSRWPIKEAMLHDLTFPGREPRSAIVATIHSPAGPLRVIATHFGLRLRERRRQAARPAALVGDGPSPVLVLGDFNEWARWGAVHRTFARLLPARTRQRTFPAQRPLLALDRIYCRPAEMLGRSWTDRAAGAASDHLPIVAEIRPASGALNWSHHSPSSRAATTGKLSSVRGWPENSRGWTGSRMAGRHDGVQAALGRSMTS
jgi:endonuclease/exonuclease/phosphatase family metal-dependent hydrolase